MTQAIVAAKLFSGDYTQDGLTHLRCRHCEARILASCSQLHLRSPACRHRRAMQRTVTMNLVRVPEHLLAEIDSAGLCVWLETSLSEEDYILRYEAWIRPKLLENIRRNRRNRTEYLQKIESMSVLELAKELA